MAGGSNNVARMSPRQRMINLMYIVLTAMLALNVSSDVLNGFRQVQYSLQNATDNMTARNKVQYRYLDEIASEDPEKAAPWLEKSLKVKREAEVLYAEIESLKTDIAKDADGPKGNYRKLINEDNLTSSTQILLNPLTNRGQTLRQQIEAYRKLVAANIADPDKRKAYEQMLSTTPIKRKDGLDNVSWEQASFENMPAIAAITYLTHLQNNIRQAESEAITNIANDMATALNVAPPPPPFTIDAKPEPPVEMMEKEDGVFTKDATIKTFEAFVIPNSTMLMRGSRYTSDIVLAAIDGSVKPRVYVGGREIPGGRYEAGTGAAGTYSYSGYIDAGGQRYPFTSSYTVVEPMATISPTMMNVLYAGIDNPISIGVPGVPMNNINASISSGSLTRNGNTWVARVSNVGSEATISVSATVNGSNMNVGSMTFRVRKLPDPLPYINLGGGVQYKGTPRRISKAALLGASGVSAALDDGILDVHYTVVSFTTITYDQMGNGIPENSAGSSFSARQIEQFKRLKVGGRFFISNIKAKGPDGITRDIPPMEVALN